MLVANVAGQREHPDFLSLELCFDAMQPLLVAPTEDKGAAFVGKVRAISNPMPWVAPVTSAILLLSTGPLFLRPSFDIGAGNLFTNGSYLPAQPLKEQANRLNPPIEIRDVKLLVRRVQVVVGKAKSHHHRGNFQHVLKIGHDRN